LALSVRIRSTRTPCDAKNAAASEHEPGAGGAALVVERAAVGDPAHVVDHDVELVAASAP
jgi:hypothetical protein